MKRKRRRSREERRLLQAREADRDLRRERANRLAEQAYRVRKYRRKIGWIIGSMTLSSVLLLLASKASVGLWVLAPSAGFLAVYLLLSLYLRKLERERDFYGWAPDTCVMPLDWKWM